MTYKKEGKNMKFIHTSDLHIGIRLYEKGREEEFRNFFRWLIDIINEEKVDLLLISGDIFDVVLPSNEARKIYYEFLADLNSSYCKDIIITSGNHDSPLFLGASKKILDCLNIKIVSEITENIEDEIVEIRDDLGNLTAIVCAVPYLREKDISNIKVGNNANEQNMVYVKSVSEHYKKIVDKALEIRKDLDIPIIAMGHLFSSEFLEADEIMEDGSRIISILGNSVSIPPNTFSYDIDYLALGHIHQPMPISKDNKMFRYSGAPLRLGFGEPSNKSISLIQSKGKELDLKLIPVPIFHNMTRIVGDLSVILDKLSELKENNADDYLEIVFKGSENIVDVKTKIDDISENASYTILKLKTELDNLTTNKTDLENFTVDSLTDDVDGIFELCIKDKNEEDKEILRRAYREAVELLFKDESC